MFRDCQFRIEGGLELGSFARTADPSGWQDAPKGGDSLNALTAKYLIRGLAKPKKVVLSDWNKRLGGPQIECTSSIQMHRWESDNF